MKNDIALITAITALVAAIGNTVAQIKHVRDNLHTKYLKK